MPPMELIIKDLQPVLVLTFTDQILNVFFIFTTDGYVDIYAIYIIVLLLKRLINLFKIFESVDELFWNNTKCYKKSYR